MKRFCMLLGILLSVGFSPDEEADSPFRPSDRWVGAFLHLHGEGVSEGWYHHPEGSEGNPFGGEAWCRGEIREMAGAGIGVALVDWNGGEAAERLLDGLVSAAVREGRRISFAPLISIPDGSDLTLPENRQSISALIRAFFERVPEGVRFVRRERPFVFWSLPGRDVKFDREGIDAIRLGLGEPVPWFVAAFAPGEETVPADACWHHGRVTDREADDRDGVMVRSSPGEEGKAWYDLQWYVALRMKPSFVLVDSWNGYAKGTEIAPSREEERERTDRTALLTEQFRRGGSVPKPEGPCTKNRSVAWTLVLDPHDRGLRPRQTPDAPYSVARLRGGSTLTTRKPEESRRRCVRFDVDDSFLYWERSPVNVSVEYLDAGEGSFELYYDSRDRSRHGKEAWFKSAGERLFGKTGLWKTVGWSLPDALFANRQDGGTDFCIVVSGRGITLRSVRVSLAGRPKGASGEGGGRSKER